MYTTVEVSHGSCDSHSQHTTQPLGLVVLRIILCVLVTVSLMPSWSNVGMCMIMTTAVCDRFNGLKPHYIGIYHCSNTCPLLCAMYATACGLKLGNVLFLLTQQVAGMYALVFGERGESKHSIVTNLLS